MRRIADLHAGEAKTDARNAAIIAEAARTLPQASMMILPHRQRRPATVSAAF
ncbi:ISSfl2 ORF [Shigella flexneri]|nr:ISSfl2 ORF [Shigella flexneri]